MKPSETLLLPSTPRLLRGLRASLAELDTRERPDLQHAARVMDQMLVHLLLREDRTPYAPLYAEMCALLDEGTAYLAAADTTPIATFAPELGFDAMQAQFGSVLAALRTRLQAAAARGDAAALDYARRVQAAELRFYTANYRPVTSAPPVAEAMTQERFEPYLLARFPGRYRRVTKFQRLVGGFQKETVLIDAERDDGSIEAMVLRGEKPDRFVQMTASEITHEYAIVKLMWQHGITVAEPLWLEDDATRLGRRFMVSRRVLGRNTGDAMGTSAKFPSELTRSYIETLARIHMLPLDNDLAQTTLNRWREWPRMPDNTREEIRFWREQIWMDRAPPSPAFARIFDWLEANVPPDEVPIGVLHNDYGPHNILCDGNRVSAVLDWEVPRIGDPAEDLSFFIQCCGDAIDRAEALQIYASLTGQHISEYRLRYFDVLSCAKVLLSGLSASTMFQATDPALLDWCQMPVLWFGMFQQQVEAKIAAAEAARGR